MCLAELVLVVGIGNFGKGLRAPALLNMPHIHGFCEFVLV